MTSSNCTGKRDRIFFLIFTASEKLDRKIHSLLFYNNFVNSFSIHIQDVWNYTLFSIKTIKCNKWPALNMKASYIHRTTSILTMTIFGSHRNPHLKLRPGNSSNILVLLFVKGFVDKCQEKIPHTGDKESLDQCEKKNK